MTRLFHRPLVWGLALVLSLSACDLTDLNVDPNAPTSATPSTLLPRGQFLISANTLDAFNFGRFAGLYAQYWTQNQYTDEDRYGFPSSRATSVNAMWNTYYIAMNNLEEIIRLYDANPTAMAAFGDRNNMEAIVLILQAYTYHLIADTWGPAPMSQALQQLDRPAPAYDTAQDMYMQILEMLTRADGLINVGAPGPLAGDLIYAGNMTRWKRFGNSVKMRVAIRIADVMEAESRTAIQQAIAAGPFASNADNALFRFSANPPYQNPIFLNYQGGRDDWAVTSTLVDYMQETADPRLPRYASGSVANPNVIVGFAYGQSEGAAGAQYAAGNYSQPHPSVRQANTPDRMMLYDEVLFIMAEAAQRGFISGSPADYYEQALRASLAHWGVTTQADVDAFVSANSYDAGNWRVQIGRQKWVALYMQGLQGWSEWRRLDFGLLRPPAAGSVVDFGRPIAIRMSYPIVEQTLNAANYREAVTNKLGGPDNQGTRLFWDVNP